MVWYTCIPQSEKVQFTIRGTRYSIMLLTAKVHHPMVYLQMGCYHGNVNIWKRCPHPSTPNILRHHDTDVTPIRDSYVCFETWTKCWTFCKYLWIHFLYFNTISPIFVLKVFVMHHRYPHWWHRHPRRLPQAYLQCHQFKQCRHRAKYCLSVSQNLTAPSTLRLSWMIWPKWLIAKAQ